MIKSTLLSTHPVMHIILSIFYLSGKSIKQALNFTHFYPYWCTGRQRTMHKEKLNQTIYSLQSYNSILLCLLLINRWRWQWFGWVFFISFARSAEHGIGSHALHFFKLITIFRLQSSCCYPSAVVSQKSAPCYTSSWFLSVLVPFHLTNFILPIIILRWIVVKEM